MQRHLRTGLAIGLILAIGVVVATIQLVRPATPVEAAPAHWHVLRTGDLAQASVERVLYEVAGHDHFFVRVRVTNRVDRPLGVDLGDYWRLIRPNQWGGLDQPLRGAINESRTLPSADSIRGDAGRALREAFAAGDLVRIEAGGHMDYYVEFNASGRADVDAVREPFLFVSLDGELLLTTGTVSEQITLEFGVSPQPGDDLDSDLILEAPFAWRTVPPDSIVVMSP